MKSNEYNGFTVQLEVMDAPPLAIDGHNSDAITKAMTRYGDGFRKNGPP